MGKSLVSCFFETQCMYNVAHARTVVRECCKGDDESQLL